MRLMIADDHPIVRNGIKMLLMSQNECEIVAETASGEETIHKVKSLQPDILLLDISMPDGNGLHVLQRLRSEETSTQCIILSNHDDEEYIVSSIKLGAKAYILKDCEPQQLLEAIETVKRGEMYFTPRVSNAMANSITEPFKYKDLTKKENEVLQLTAQGLSSKMVADQLNTSIRTVETHRYRIMKKLNAANSAEMVRIAFEKNMVKR